MGFMQRQVTRKMNWIQVETNVGTEYIPGDLGIFVRNSECASQPLTETELHESRKKLQDYVEGSVIHSWENIRGYGARLSAPGYLDCTEWNVFPTEQEAREYLDENYPEDDETEEN